MPDEEEQKRPDAQVPPSRPIVTNADDTHLTLGSNRATNKQGQVGMRAHVIGKVFVAQAPGDLDQCHQQHADIGVGLFRSTFVDIGQVQTTPGGHLHRPSY
jgi:hypothetical protein